MTLSRLPRCAYCGSGNNIYSCRGCKFIWYCGADHEASHSDVHKEACDIFQQSCVALKNDQLLYDLDLVKQQRKQGSAVPSNDSISNYCSMSESIPQDQRGRFQGRHQDTPFMRHRLWFINGLLKIKTYEAVHIAQENLMKYMYLCGGENIKARDLVPAVDLRLGKDQECYNFCKWCAIKGRGRQFDWNSWDHFSSSNLEQDSSDVFEPVANLSIDQATPLSHMSAIILLKIRILLTLRAVDNADLLPGMIPGDIFYCIRSLIVQDTIIEHRKDLYDLRKRRPAMKRVQQHINELYGVMSRRNKNFWPALLESGDDGAGRLKKHSRGPLHEVQLALRYTHDAWLETPFAIDFIRKLHESFSAT